MSQRRGGRSGVSTRVVGDIAGRLRDIRALWYAVNNDPHKSVEDLASEFYFAVGDIFEGHTLQSLALEEIDRERVLAHVEE